MSAARIFRRVSRPALSILAAAALTAGASGASAAPRAPEPAEFVPAESSAHPYRLAGGVLHARPEGIPASAAGPAATANAAKAAMTGTVIVWSQFAPDWSGIHLMIATGDGSDAHELTTAVEGVWDLDPRISPDQRSVLFERDTDDGVEVVVIGIDGQGERVIPLGCSGPCAGDVSPTWGPAGDTIWFTRVLGPFDETGTAASAVLWAADASGQSAHQVTPAGIAGPYEEYSAKFFPDMDRVFIRLRNADLATELVRTDETGSDHVLTDWAISADIFDVSPAATGPTSRLVVFETYGHGAPDGVASAVATVPGDCVTVTVCMARVKYLTPTAIDPDDPAENYNPVWSPDGRRIAYVHAFYGTEADPAFGADIWTMAWNGVDRTPFTDDGEWDFRPDWGWAPAG